MTRSSAPFMQDLNSGWTLAEAAPGAEPEAPWIPAAVPGDIHLDLMAAGRIPDPFIGDQWQEGLFIEDRDWWYRGTVTLSPDAADLERVELVFDGLDTFATVYLDGEPIAESHNMWIPQRVDVTDRLEPGRVQDLRVRFTMPEQAVADRLVGLERGDVDWLFSPPERIFSRKAQMSFGWDIAPRIVTCGLWRPVRLEGFHEGAIRDAHFRSELLPDGRARVSLEVEAEAFATADEWRAVASARCGDSAVAWEMTLEERDGRLVGRADAIVAAPQLWWPAGEGEQNLYRAEVALVADGHAVHTVAERFGIREVRLLQSDETGLHTRFHCAVNGRRTFILGTNWIPIDAIFPRVTRERLAQVLDLAGELNCNMLRIWGGGIYESPDFYELCDERGLLIWQDFMFACALYPQDDAFLAEVRAEAEAVVRRLRNHPCMAIWAGDNEVDWAYEWTGDASRAAGNRISHAVLPEVVARLDPDLPYIPSSPFSPSGEGSPNSPDEGDVHIWSHSAHPRDPMYFDEHSRFISEMGRICPANVESIRQFLPPEAAWPHANPTWDHHLGNIPTQDFRRRDAMDQALVNVFGAVPDTLESYVEASQLQQAYCLSEWIQRSRRRWPECGGLLWWNLMDNWPQHSDAIVDHFLRRKIGYEAVRVASLPVIPSLAAGEDGWEVWLLNRGPSGVSGTVAVDLAGIDGTTERLAELGCRAGPGESARIDTLAATAADPDRQYLLATLCAEGQPPVRVGHVLDGCRSIDVLRAVYASP